MLRKIKKNKVKILIPIIVLISCVGIYFFAKSFAEQLEDNVRVAENSDLTYYLDVIYDGKDEAEVTSSDTATASVFSDYINVEDRLPDGLIFQDFESTEDGSIGAVARDESGKSCTGYVVGGYDGLKYENGVVSFKVKIYKQDVK